MLSKISGTKHFRSISFLVWDITKNFTDILLDMLPNLLSQRAAEDDDFLNSLLQKIFNCVVNNHFIAKWYQCLYANGRLNSESVKKV